MESKEIELMLVTSNRKCGYMYIEADGLGKLEAGGEFSIAYKIREDKTRDIKYITVLNKKLTEVANKFDPWYNPIDKAAKIKDDFLKYLTDTRIRFVLKLWDERPGNEMRLVSENLLMAYDEVIQKFKNIGPAFPGDDIKIEVVKTGTNKEDQAQNKGFETHDVETFLRCTTCNNTGWEEVADDGNFYCDCVIGQAIKADRERQQEPAKYKHNETGIQGAYNCDNCEQTTVIGANRLILCHNCGYKNLTQIVQKP